MNKSKIIICFSALVLLFWSIIFLWNYNDSNEYKLDEVQLKNNTIINNNLAIMVEKNDGNGYEKVDEFPNGLVLSTELSGCIDKNGVEIEDAIEYKIETMSLKLKSKGSSYCYLYFLRDAEAPEITLSIINNYYTSAKLSLSSNEAGTYCVNTSGTKGDTDNCILKGTLSENSMIVTKMFTESNTYYVHIKDSVGNETISEALDIKVLYQKVEYLDGSGTQYIDTGLTVNKTDTWQYIIDANFTNSSWGGANGYLQFQASLARGTRKTIRIDYVSYYEKIYVNDVLNTTNNWTSSYNGSSVKIGILKMGDASNAWYSDSPQTGKVYSVKISKSGILVRDFIPVYRTSDNVVGMFDEVNNVFYTNAGTGTFGKGSNVS